MNYVKKKSYNLINLIFRSFHVKSAALYKKLFCAYVIPVATYCIELYGGANVYAINELERIVRYFTKRLWLRLNPNIDPPPYTRRLLVFGLIPLESQRIFSDLVFFFKIARGFVRVPSYRLSFSLTKHRIVIQRVRSSLSKRFFTHRSSMLWNKIIREQSWLSFSVNQFKDYLSKRDLSPFMERRTFKAF